MKKRVNIILGIALIIWGVFFYTQLRAQELNAVEEFFEVLGSGNADTLMDSDQRNPGNDKIRCLKYEDCPEWNGDPDTKVYYDLMKLDNGSGVIAKSDFNWNVHLYLCHQNKLLDSINGEGAFEKLAIISAKEGWIPCPINVNPHWSYDWEGHILNSKEKV